MASTVDSSDLLAVLASIKESEKYSDLQIKVAGRVFNVHRNIVCPQSEYFSKMLEGSFTEANTRVVELHEDEPEAIKRMIDFFYTATYADAPLDFDRDADSIQHTLDACAQVQLTNIAMYALGEKYLIPKLKNLALKRFKTGGCLCWAFSDSSFADILRLIYTSTPGSDRGLRDIMMGHSKMLASHLENVFEVVPEAHVDVLKGRMAKMESDLKRERVVRARLEERCKMYASELNRTLSCDCVGKMGNYFRGSEDFDYDAWISQLTDNL